MRCSVAPIWWSELCHAEGWAPYWSKYRRGTGYSAEGLVLKIFANHFAGAMPVHGEREFAQQAVPGTPWVDIPKVPIGSPTYPLDVVAALSSDRKKLLLGGEPHGGGHSEFSPRVTGVKLRGPGKLSQIAPHQSEFGESGRARSRGSRIVENPQNALGETVQVPPVSVGLYEFEIDG